MGYAAKVCKFFKKCWNVIKKIWRAIVKFSEVVQILKNLVNQYSATKNAIAVAVKDGNNVLETVIQNGEMNTNTSLVLQGEQVAADVDREFVL